MVNLTTEDRQHLIVLLTDLPVLASEGARREILELAGLKQMIPMIDLSGAPLIAVSRIVSYLSSFGRLTYDNEALGLFLNFIKSLTGVQQQELLGILLTKYNMMTPIAPSPKLDNWRGIESEESVLEKVIGENTLRPIAFLTQGLQVAQSVAYIGVHAGANALTVRSGSQRCGDLCRGQCLLSGHTQGPAGHGPGRVPYEYCLAPSGRGHLTPIDPGGLTGDQRGKTCPGKLCHLRQGYTDSH